jgi:hypothetical protein
MNAATTTEWLLAAAIGTIPLPVLAAAVHFADRDLPHLSLHGAVNAAEHAAQWTRLQAVALLMFLAWHLQPKEAR